ncbi:DUF599 domain-containing protein [Thalassotalea sp. LPB0316]|uniref:DUF599 domain-containing protein n=1 Tax=Thalassotalea sp. LPB0316 TaxID=2769490 RepID=UPI001867A4D2|nr:DUF599 domain-containing protein [Thalassotalea sp. LPB0316]QOL25204.1 DUF599 domain-containing protein [Thalassotalea sp. LPB0316]
MMLSFLDLIAAAFFVCCWYGYTTFARKKAKTTDCIARCLHQHRIHWMHELIGHEIRVSDASLLANLERNIAFFASSTLLVLAGLLALFAKVEHVATVINSLPYAAFATEGKIQMKISLLVFIFVLAFFNFTWSMRQYGFLNVMVGAMPVDGQRENENLKRYARQMAIVQDQAAHSYNYGLRAYYFSLAALSWFYHPLLFMFASAFVVYTLYIREFQSKAVKAITAGQEILNQERDI